MARSLDDDYRHRTAAVDEESGNELTHAQLRRLVKEQEQELARRRLLDRAFGAAVLTAACCLVVALCVTVLNWEDPDRYARQDIVCGALFALSVGVSLAIHKARSGLTSRHELELMLEQNGEVLRWANAKSQPTLGERRKLYREDVSGMIEHYQAESRKYRRVHNILQSMVMIGSALTTMVAAFDVAKELTPQSVTIVVISFAITLATAFTGYYKYRERSYFLQQTADSIEEEANALALGVGEYHEYGSDQEDQALARFTHRVESLRNEQRRRQQQLDQPADQDTPAGQQQA
ncbi:DUF4231 domain-containing protein [Streptomyces sp. NPDC088270]|uniref:DUF4231 domain-containing protein n=1 Tax=Streptomyces sp. NPDC088270 TaxID=3160990 RepID=UPI00343C6778